MIRASKKLPGLPWALPLISLLAILTFAFPRAVNAQDESTPASILPTASVPTPVAPPKDAQEVAERRALIQTRLDGLTKRPPSTQPTTQPVSQQAKDQLQAEADLRAVLENYLKVLDSLVELRARVATLQSKEWISERSKALEEYNQRIAQLDANLRSPPPPSAVDSALEQISTEFDQHNTLYENENKQQTSRLKQLADLDNAIAAANTEVAEARGRLDERLKAETPAPAPTTQPAEALDPAVTADIKLLKARKAAWEVSTAMLQVETLTTQKSVLNLEKATAQTALPVLQNYVAKLGEYRTLLQSRRTRDDVKQLEEALSNAKTDEHKVYFEWRLRLAKAIRFLENKQESARKRFPINQSQDVVRDVERLSNNYQRLIGGLSRAAGDEKKQAFRDLNKLINTYRTQYLQLIAKLDQSQRERDEILDWWDREIDALDEFESQMRAVIEKIQDPERRNEADGWAAEIAATHRPKANKAMQDARDAEAGLIARLAESVKLLDGFLIKLGEYREKLYWSYIFAPDVRLWAAVRSGYTELRSDASAENLRNISIELRNSGDRVQRWQWIVSAVLLVCGVIAGFVGRFRLMARTLALEAAAQDDLADSDMEQLPVSTRYRIQQTRTLASWLPIAAPCIALLIFLAVLGGWRDPWPRLTMCALLFIVAASALRSWVRHLFDPRKARFRLIQCSRVVALHYRRWASIILWLSVVVLPPALLARALDFVPAAASALLSVYRTLVILSLLMFALQRSTVVRVVGRRYAQQHPRLLGFIVGAYPLIVIVLIALLVLQAIGFDALVAFVLSNVVLTILIIVAASFLSHLITDLLHVGRAAGEGEAGGGAAAATDEAKLIDALMEDVEARELGLVKRMAAFVCRFALLIAAVICIAWAWGMTRITARNLLLYHLLSPEGDSPGLTVWRIVAAVMAAVLAVKMSRGLRAALQAKVYPAYGAIDVGAQATINALLHYTLVVLGLYIALRLVNINLGALVVLMGGLGLGIGLGLQPLIVNFVSGMVIFAERHIKVGDIVDIDGTIGEVSAISMRSTQVRSFDNIHLVIPNTELVTSKVINWTYRDKTMRGKIDVGVGYGSDPHRVRELLLQVARGEPRVLPFPEPAVWFLSFGASSLDFTMACWFRTPGDRWEGMVAMRYEIARVFRENGIEIPFPQRTLSFEKGAVIPIRVSRESSRRETPLPEDEGLAKDER